MGSTTILRGFRVSVIALDNFLCANGVDETYGTPPFFKRHPDNDPISILLYNKLVGFAGDASMIDKNDYRVAMPHVQEYQESRVAYVTYAWQVVWAHREIDLEKLPAEPPEAFEQLRNEIMSFGEGLDKEERISDDGKLGLYAVHTYEIRGSFTPQEVIDRFTVPQYCDQCEATFEPSVNPYRSVWFNRQKHRIEVHGSKEGYHDMPEA